MNIDSKFRNGKKGGLRRVISGTLAAALLAASIMSPAFAATNTYATIDTSRTGTVNIHKLIDNDGNLVESDGLADSDESRIPVNNIGFDYVKIADIEQISGIIISEDGSINWDADGGEVSVGTYYTATDALPELTSVIGVFPEATYVKTSVAGDEDAYPNLQYEWADMKAAGTLASEQAAVEAAEEALAAAASNLTEAYSTYQSAQSDYDSALETYEAAVEDLDSAAAAAGIVKVYTAEEIQDVVDQITATLGEETVNDWIAANAESETGYTDDNGTVSFSGLELGLYLFAETDISYHDGYAGSSLDETQAAAGNYSINNDVYNYFDEPGGTYYIYPVDGHSQTTVHSYEYGEVYKESVNPEYPVIESKSTPFLVSVPTTNTTDTTEETAAADDNYGTAGTVWQYTIDVYPKNQTTSIYKRIVDPDEADGDETLRTSEDYQIGDTIEQLIFAEAPALQGDNEHLGYVISDKMTDGLTFVDVTEVTVVSASSVRSASNEDTVTTIYYDPYGTVCTAEEALDEDGNLRYITTYVDNEGNEISEETYNSASSLNVGEYTAITRYYSKKTSVGAAYTASAPTSASAFDYDVDTGFALTEGEDYTVVDISESSVTLTDADGNVQTVIEKGEFNGFAVVLTEAGLAKLNALDEDVFVAVRFDSILNENAMIGTAYQNMNYATLYWVNSNTSFRKITSNEVYDYTYELILKKDGVTDYSAVKFVVSRTDTNDIAQADEKDLTDTVSGVKTADADDSMRFVKESDGVYHVWTGEDDGDPEVTEINGVEYYTVTPSSVDGTIQIKGLDSDTYTFEEIQTEDGKNLLKETFSVEITAADDEDASMRDGRIESATVASGSGDPVDITVGVVGTSATDTTTLDNGLNLGIASMSISNYSTVLLRTGGVGRTIIYIVAFAMIAGLAVGAVVISKKKKDENDENAQA